MQFGIAYGREFDRKNRNPMGVVIPDMEPIVVNVVMESARHIT